MGKYRKKAPAWDQMGPIPAAMQDHFNPTRFMIPGTGYVYLGSEQEYMQYRYGYSVWGNDDLLTQARQLAEHAHKNQYDLADVPYIEHVKRVVDRVAWCDENVIAVAWLHDVVEDTQITQEVINRSFPETVARGVEAMTQRDNEPLESYWTRVHNNREAFIVKLHGDMPDNNDPKRRVLDAHRNKKIGTKYATAIDFFWQLGQH